MGLNVGLIIINLVLYLVLTVVRLRRKDNSFSWSYYSQGFTKMEYIIIERVRYFLIVNFTVERFIVK